MDRRNFVKNSLMAGGAVMASASTTFASDDKKSFKGEAFKAKFAANFYLIMKTSTKGMSFVDKLRFFYDCGFRALEDNDMARRSVEDQKIIAKEMERLGMEMGVYTSYAPFNDLWMTGNRANYKQKVPDKKEAIERIKKQMLANVEVGKRVNAKFTTIVPGMYDEQLDFGFQFANVLEHLKYATEICEKAGLTIVLEPLCVRHPGMWLRRSADAYALCKAVGSPHCKILYDVYHQQVTEGNLMRSMELAWDEIGYFHFGDVPMRTEPESGEINYRNITQYIWDKGYRGCIGTEHFLSDVSVEGEKKFLDAYRLIDVK